MTKRLRQFATWLERTSGRTPILADYTVENLHAMSPKKACEIVRLVV